MKESIERVSLQIYVKKRDIFNLLSRFSSTKFMCNMFYHSSCVATAQYTGGGLELQPFSGFNVSAGAKFCFN